MNLFPCVAVCEGSARWTPELQRQFAVERVSVRGCRRIVDLEPMSESADVIVIDFDSDPAGCLQFLGRRIGQPGDGRVIAVGSPRTAALEWTVRDLGVLDFLAEAPPGHSLAGLCRRQWTIDGTATV